MNIFWWLCLFIGFSLGVLIGVDVESRKTPIIHSYPITVIAPYDTIVGGEFVIFGDSFICYPSDIE